MSPTDATLPKLPRLVLRIGFAGSQRLTAETSGLSAALDEIFETLARRLAEIAPGPPILSPTPESGISQFYSMENPMLRLVTGLCEGGDSLAAQAFEKLDQHSELHLHIATELAAVIPYELPIYRASRSPVFLREFDRQAARCAYILALDGRYEKPNPDTPEARNCRARAYRAQSTLLLRHADIIIAVADPDGEERAGGTLETVRAALDFDLPVVFLHARTGKISLIEPGDDPGSTLATLAVGEDIWAATLRGWVTTIVADPDVGGMPEPTNVTDSRHMAVANRGEKLLDEFFHSTDTPPQKLVEAGKFQRNASYGERCWTNFEGWFRSGPGPKSDPALQPYAGWRARSTGLNYHYAGLFRGTFLMNYSLAVIAVLLAALSLVLLRYARPDPAGVHTPAVEAFHKVVVTAFESGPAQVTSPVSNSPSWLFPILLILGALKLWCVWRIYRNTHRASRGYWNDKAMAYRYLAERLRTMFYLPRIGSFQPPAAAPSQYASRVVRQSAVDWLLDAIVRSVSPASLAMARIEHFRFPEGNYDVMILRLEPLGLLADVRDRWIKEQAVYHDRNARTMARIHAWTENWGRVFNLAVIGFVVIDITILLADLSGIFPEAWSLALHGYSPWLAFLAAILPATVISLNGIRSQSECRRLAERSAVIRAILSGRPSRKAAEPPTIWQKLLIELKRPFAFIRTLFPFATKQKLILSLDLTGSKLAAADRLQTRIAFAIANPSTDPGSWTPEILRYAESVANVFVQEVAEWSVLYAKEAP